MSKYKTTEPKFSVEVQDYKFMEFDAAKLNDRKNIKFQPATLIERELFDADKEESFKLAVNHERKVAEKNSFEVHSIVKKYRGIEEQEKLEREQKISAQVEKIVADNQASAFKQGYEQGVKEGKQAIIQSLSSGVDQKLSILEEMIQDVLMSKAEILQAQKQEVYMLMRDLTKWIILRELKEDGAYIERLLEKLVLELQTKTNLLIQVDKDSFDGMDEVLERVQKNLGKFNNVRVEVGHQLDGRGIVIDSDNGIINGGLSDQLRALDKMFEAVGLPFNDSSSKV